MLHIPAGELKNIIIASGLLTEKDYKEAEDEAARTERAIFEVLLEKGLITEIYLTQILGEYYHVPFTDLQQLKIPDETLKLIPEQFARAERLIAFDKDKNGIKVAMVDPGNLKAIDFLSHRLGIKIIPHIASENDLKIALGQYKRSITAEFKNIILENIKKTKTTEGDTEKMARDIPIISILDTILEYAAAGRASDIHLEPIEDKLQIRYRIDGILRDIIDLPILIHPALIARVKILSGLQIDEHRIPQDGRFKFKFEDEEVAVRVSVVPTFYGEKVVLRLLVESGKPFNLEDIGLSPADLEKVKNASLAAHGMILATGPTGCGKTTTLYTILHLLNKPEINISTIEDPIEYDIRRINQLQVNEKTGLTFAEGLRSLLRQDPDILMVGEIRDKETADIAVHSALTGHLMLSTLHTNNAAGAIPRLLDIGIEPFLLASTINIVIAQRLVRKICKDCIKSKALKKNEVTAIEKQINGQLAPYGHSIKMPTQIYYGVGCKVCNNTGYKGQIAIFEVLTNSSKIQTLVVERAPGDKIELQAISEGMTTMLEDGIRKVEAGITTVEEILRVTRE